MTREERLDHSHLLGRGQGLQLLWPGRLSEEVARGLRAAGWAHSGPQGKLAGEMPGPGGARGGGGGEEWGGRKGKKEKGYWYFIVCHILGV